MSIYSSEKCKSLSPYTAGEQPKDMKYIKLNTNENPYPPSPRAVEALKAFDCGRLKLYSDPENLKLKEAIADNFNLKVANVFVGNGSDEVLSMCFAAFADKTVAFADVTYSFYPVYCDFYSLQAKILPLKENFEQDIDLYEHVDADMIVIANPNAPTAIGLNESELLRIIETNRDKAIIIDEAYSDFMNYSAVELTNRYDNLLVVRTFSKSYSLAGARCGYALGNERLIADLEKIKNSFNSYTVNSMTELIATEAMRDIDYFANRVEDVIATRDKYALKLKELGFDMTDSQANFLFVTHPQKSAEYLYNRLKQEGILVRYFAKPRIDNYLRITVGVDSDMQVLCDKLQSILAQ